VDNPASKEGELTTTHALSTFLPSADRDNRAANQVVGTRYVAGFRVVT
jgi:hypothetical protein